MPRFNVLQIFLGFLALATFGLNLGVMFADVPSITLRITLPLIFLAELVILALTFLPKKKTVVRRSAPITTKRARKVVKRAQPHGNLGTPKPDNAMWKWIKGNLSKAFQDAKPRAAAALSVARDSTQDMLQTVRAETQQGRTSFMEGVKSFFSSKREATGTWVKAILADLFGKLKKLITGGYGMWALLLFWSLTVLLLYYPHIIGGHILDEVSEVWAWDHSFVYGILFILFLAFVIRKIHKHL